jgi:hypothetical protein
VSTLVAIGLAGVACMVGGLILARSAQRHRAPLIAVTPEGAAGRVVTPASRPERARRNARVLRPSASLVLFLVSAALYLGVGAYLVFHEHAIIGDSLSRVSNAYAVLFSRDPHLAAIGFVWGPLPSLLEMPLLLFKGWWPALADRAFAGTIVSALFMAGAVVQLRSFSRELGAPAPVAWVLTVAFALNPMVLYYGANGMSEALGLFLLLVVARYLARWLQSGGVRPLVISGLALAAGYLVRYEFAAVAGAAILIVGVASFVRAVGARRERWLAALADLAVFSIPFIASFIGWAVLSRVITGHYFEEFASQYGNAAQIQASGGVATSQIGHSLAAFAGKQMVLMAPLLPIVAVVAILVAWDRRDARVWALATLAASLVMTYLTFVSGSTFPFFRYYLPALPLMLLCIASMLSAPVGARARAGGSASALSPVLAAAIALPLAFSSTAAVIWALGNGRYAPEEYANVTWVVSGTHTHGQREQAARVSSAQKIQRTIDALDLPSGAVLVDVDLPCAQLAVMMSDSPHQFVITSDRDFRRILADPKTFHAQYMLVPRPSSTASLDALNEGYPQLYASGNGFARLARDLHTSGCPDYRLYRVVSSLRPG